MSRFYRDTGEGVLLFMRLQPAARANALGGLRQDADGGLRLEARVTAPPEDGKANAALIKLLAKRLRLAKSDITILAGAAAREKTLLLRGDPSLLKAALENLVSE